MADTMIERVARILAAEAGYLGDDAWRNRTEQAKRVLTAMREPTGAVLVSGIGPLNRRDGALPASDTVGEIWRAQIDALLAEGA